MNIEVNNWVDETVERLDRYGRLIVVRYIPPNEQYIAYVNVQDDQARWLCLCDCGQIRVVTKECLCIGYTNCCGRCEEIHQAGNDFYELIRIRDNYICQKCGKTQEQEDRKLDVHHINGIHTDDRNENAMTLCRSCHIIGHGYVGAEAWDEIAAQI